MLASERLLEIEEKFEAVMQRIVPIEMDGETLRLIMYLKDDTNLRVTEQWDGMFLKRYSYYWLDPAWAREDKRVVKQEDKKILEDERVGNWEKKKVKD